MGLKDKAWEFVPLPLVFCFFGFALINPGDLFRIKGGFERPQGWELILGWVWTVSLHVQSLLFRWILKSVFPKVWVLLQLREVSFEHVVFGISVYWNILYSCGYPTCFEPELQVHQIYWFHIQKDPLFGAKRNTPTGCYLGITRMTWDIFLMF